MSRLYNSGLKPVNNVSFPSSLLPPLLLLPSPPPPLSISSPAPTPPPPPFPSPHPLLCSFPLSSFASLSPLLPQEKGEPSKGDPGVALFPSISTAWQPASAPLRTILHSHFLWLRCLSAPPPGQSEPGTLSRMGVLSGQKGSSQAFTATTWLPAQESSPSRAELSQKEAEEVSESQTPWTT